MCCFRNIWVFHRGKTRGRFAAWISYAAEAEKSLRISGRHTSSVLHAGSSCSSRKVLKSCVPCPDVPPVCFTVIKVETNKTVPNPKRDLRRFLGALATFHVPCTVPLAEWFQLSIAGTAGLMQGWPLPFLQSPPGNHHLLGAGLFSVNFSGLSVAPSLSFLRSSSPWVASLLASWIKRITI